MPYAGRGGAGNIQTVQQEEERVAADLEAGQEVPYSYAAEAPRRTEQPYAYKGRGGAGNYYIPRELNEKGTYQDTNLSQSIGKGANALGDGASASANIQSNKTVGSGTSRTYGRGGAGNYSFDASESEERTLQRKMKEEEEKRTKLTTDIERGVQESLALPPKARLPGGRPY